MFAIRVLVLCSICSLAFSQITQKDACQKFTNAVVQIDAGGSSRGTGFLVSPDGWILTAAHVILDPESTTAKTFESITVTLPTGHIEIATPVLPIEQNMLGADYALLKIAGENLPHLDLGEKPDDVVLGSDLTIVGFPFSAVGFHSNGPSVKDKFCLSATVAYSGLTDVDLIANTQKGTSTIKVKVDVIYFQGPSVKGLSGSPIISRDTGHVIAILTSKLTGIAPELEQAGESLQGMLRGGANVTMGPVSVLGTLSTIIGTLDAQLANGLGAGTGIEDAKAAMRHALRQRKARAK